MSTRHSEIKIDAQVFLYDKAREVQRSCILKVVPSVPH